jgi:hypothetical protein
MDYATLYGQTTLMYDQDKGSHPVSRPCVFILICMLGLVLCTIQ